MPSIPTDKAEPRDQSIELSAHSSSSYPASSSVPLTVPNTKVWRPTTWGVLLASPILYGMFIPLLFLDLSLTIYHWTVFPLLRISRIQRSTYIRLDRHRLAYLPWIVKLTCTYCGYANGLLHYGVRLAGDTEAYFCPIKHQLRQGKFHPPPHHRHFAPFGNAKEFDALYQPKNT
ncbi:MAG: hypothetical protein AB7T38_07580 [Nitrospirales bacterium]